MTSFFDSNILLYLVDEGAKTGRAQELIDAGGIISVQVLNEFVDVCRRKHKMPFEYITGALAPVKDALTIVDLTLVCHDLAFEIAASNKLRIYDASIIAAAELSSCNVLYTEDMNHGQRIGRVEIRNPFV